MTIKKIDDSYHIYNNDKDIGTFYPETHWLCCTRHPEAMRFVENLKQKYIVKNYYWNTLEEIFGAFRVQSLGDDLFLIKRNDLWVIFSSTHFVEANASIPLPVVQQISQFHAYVRENPIQIEEAL